MTRFPKTSRCETWSQLKLSFGLKRRERNSVAVVEKTGTEFPADQSVIFHKSHIER